MITKRLWRYRLGMLLVLLLAFAIRTYRLDSQALRGDEAATVLYAALPLSDLWELSRITDPHPPLYYAMLHPWQWLFGESAWVMRFAGVCASTLAVGVLYRLSIITLRRPAPSLIAAGLLAINPLQIWLAQDVRSYPFFTLLGLLSSWALWAALMNRSSVGSRQKTVARGQYSAISLQQPATGGFLSPVGRFLSRIFHHWSSISWTLYIVLTITSLYIHYYTVFLIAFQGLFVIVNARQFWHKKWPWLISQVVIALLIIPGLSLAYNFVGGEAGGGVAEIGLPEIVQRTIAALLTGVTLESNWGGWVSLLLLPVWIIGLINLVRQNLTTGTFWVLFFAVPTLGVILLSIDRPFFKERFLVQAQPAFMVLLAAGFVWLWDAGGRRAESQLDTQYARRNTYYAFRIVATILLVVLISASVRTLANYHTNPAYAKAPPWHFYRDYVARYARPSDVMLTNFPEAAVSYYSPNDLPFYVVPAERDLPVEARLEQTQQIASAYNRIWFLPMLRQGFDEQGDVLDWLDRHTDRIDQTFFPGYNLNLYLSPDTFTGQMIPYPASFAHGINLRGYQVFNKRGESQIDLSGDAPMLTLAPDDEFTLSLYWQADMPSEVPFTVFVHLIAADGFNRTGQDNQPVWGSYPTTSWSPGEQVTDKYTLTLPPGTPSGDHFLRVGWYQNDTQVRVPLVNAAGNPIDDNLLLNLIVHVR